MNVASMGKAAVSVALGLALAAVASAAANAQDARPSTVNAKVYIASVGSSDLKAPQNFLVTSILESFAAKLATFNSSALKVDTPDSFSLTSDWRTLANGGYTHFIVAYTTGKFIYGKNVHEINFVTGKIARNAAGAPKLTFIGTLNSTAYIFTNPQTTSSVIWNCPNHADNKTGQSDGNVYPPGCGDDKGVGPKLIAEDEFAMFVKLFPETGVELVYYVSCLEGEDSTKQPFAAGLWHSIRTIQSKPYLKPYELKIPQFCTNGPPEEADLFIDGSVQKKVHDISIAVSVEDEMIPRRLNGKYGNAWSTAETYDADLVNLINEAKASRAELEKEKDDVKCHYLEDENTDPRQNAENLATYMRNIILHLPSKAPDPWTCNTSK